MDTLEINIDMKMTITIKKVFISLFVIYISGCGSSSEESGDVLVDSNVDDLVEVDSSCQAEGREVNWQALLSAECKSLSSYNLFSNEQDPRAGVNAHGMRYELNSELFTDYARKYRYVFIPPSKEVQYSEQEAFNFPVGTVLVKVFALPLDTSLPEENIIEIRLLIHRDSGWVGLVYVWHKDSAEGLLDLDSESIEFSLKHDGERYSGEYTVPSFGSCANCHQLNEKVSPIGPKARLLNKEIEFEGRQINQLQLWSQQGLLLGLPDDLSAVDFAPDWRDESESLELRAKAYLDINCAHCHREAGAASLSGLKLEFGRKAVDYNHGVCNSAHGWRGGGYDIWPGDSENSSIPLRMTLPGAPDRMPPLGRSIVDVEAVKLIRQWIDSMPYQECAQ